MAALNGWLARSPLGAYVNGHLTPDFEGFEVDYWPLHDATISRTSQASLITHWPVSMTPRALNGSLARGFVDDWYYRIHVRPAVLALGNIVSAQVVQVRVWNAWFVPRTLTAVSGVQEGLVLTPPHGIPTTYQPLQESVWQVTVERDGPSRIDASIAFSFTGVPAPPLRVTGGRVVEWPFRPDWSDGITERLAWKTDVLTSASAAEQRRALRGWPRRSFELRFIVEGRDRRVADLALAGWGASTWSLPIWPDAQVLAADLGAGALTLACATEGFDWRDGGLAMLIGEHALAVETVEIESIEPGGLTLKRPVVATWPAGTIVCPARMAELVQQPSVTRKTDQLSVVSGTFEVAEACDWPAALPVATYRGAPLFTERPDESEDLTHGWTRLQLMLDNGSGLPRRSDTAGVGLPVHAHAWTLMGRAEHSAWRSLLYGLMGRLQPMWLPTHADDLTLAAITPATGLALDVEACGLARFIGAAPPPGRRDLRIELSDGSAVHCAVTGVTELEGGLERLAISATPGVELRPAGAAGVHVTRMSWLQLCRLDSDELELVHITDGDGAARCTTVFRALRDEVELA
ncbi:MAG: hypothetical protein LCI02_04825 [Proteobacteria bacterium]|nr:hypothetical protein [Pseudomonadota bacterium]